jgi:uncharacterized protein DUF6644
MYRILPQAFFQWCAATPLGKFIAASVWTMPILETFHIMGLMFLLGAAFTLNLTVLGVGVRMPSDRLASQLLPWAASGLAIAIVTGIPMFMSAAPLYGNSGPFALKMTLLVSAIVLQTVIHNVRGMYGSPVGRVVACVTLVCWFGIAYAGRAIAFSNLLGMQPY